ncbi:hypothetical protein FACS1894105_14220 [Clostridia bacterium]|nr:hypothetical protein FACS1894105_14220 [Clostridia bacterium]
MREYILKRSSRKSIALRITPDGIAEVRAPLKLAKREIDRFVAEHEDWIVKHLKLLSERAASPPVEYSAEQISGFRAKALAAILPKIAVYAPLLNVTPDSVKINSAKTRWGSCVRRRKKVIPAAYTYNLNFSWRLALTEEDLIEYVVVHELAHIKEMSHSAKFWAIVEIIVPDYRNKRKRLKLYANK